MPKVNLVSLKPHTYAGERLQAGDEFNAPSSHAKVLIAIKRARRAVAAPPAVAEDDAANITKAAPAAAALDALDKPKRTYTRKPKVPAAA